MPHRVKNKHRARHRAHTVKSASLSMPALPLPAMADPQIENAPAPEQINTPTHEEASIGNE